MPNNGSYPIFIFFGTYLCFATYINIRYFTNMDSDVKAFDKEKAAIELTIFANQTQTRPLTVSL
jgi:hypothetical protein